MSSPNVSNASLWTGRIVSALPALLLIFSAVMKIIKHKSAIDGFAQFGIPADLMVPIGILELCCAAHPDAAAVAKLI